ncbi:hypothetical protein DAEQUDRAFT_308254 [Daedalea quercina L-15889]|uniref:Uncharacterized protein n=1 Tax=Daedalea quercina L-15889 TaxID=1314783 RepID=A0A165PXQ8_9APHY|nr:hypothetical protein DAEQUDRAFT_308254 [Daedalea quercina L-15889]
MPQSLLQLPNLAEGPTGIITCHLTLLPRDVPRAKSRQAGYIRVHSGCISEYSGDSSFRLQGCTMRYTYKCRFYHHPDTLEECRRCALQASGLMVALRTTKRKMPTRTECTYTSPAARRHTTPAT